VKPFVIQRKVFQTSGSYAGARYTAKLFSIVQTCKINNINVERYFKYVLENIHCESGDSLLPYSSEIKKKYSNSPIPPGVI
ncbi:MAG: transposase domain-containing protein, partial [Bacilli bacterium]|nr:transposase domain-containing protein [Bacilli bacterium]